MSKGLILEDIGVPPDVLWMLFRMMISQRLCRPPYGLNRMDATTHTMERTELAQKVLQEILNAPLPAWPGVVVERLQRTDQLERELALVRHARNAAEAQAQLLERKLKALKRRRPRRARP